MSTPTTALLEHRHIPAPLGGGARYGQWDGMTPPDGMDVLAQRVRHLPPPVHQWQALARHIHAGADLATSCAVSGMDPDRALDALSMLGTHLAQSTKAAGPPIAQVMEASRGRRAGYVPGSVTATSSGYIVICADGWTGAGRDLRRAYANVALTELSMLDQAIERLSHHSDTQVNAKHYRDLYLAVTQRWWTVSDIATDPGTAALFLTAWQRVDAAVTDAVAALQQDPQAVNPHERHRRSWWLAPRHSSRPVLLPTRLEHIAPASYNALTLHLTNQHPS